jgi:hypothetical protein
MEKTARELPAAKNVHLSAIADRLTSSIASLKEATQWIAQAYAAIRRRSPRARCIT